MVQDQKLYEFLTNEKYRRKIEKDVSEIWIYFVYSLNDNDLEGFTVRKIRKDKNLEENELAQHMLKAECFWEPQAQNFHLTNIHLLEICGKQMII